MLFSDDEVLLKWLVRGLGTTGIALMIVALTL
jgi:hypothetical protein